MLVTDAGKGFVPKRCRWARHLYQTADHVEAWVVEALSTTKPTAGRAIEALEAVGVLVETTGKKRDRVYAYHAYLDRLRTGTELDEE